MEHSFNIEVASEVGVNCAIIYKNLSFWCLKNKANKKNLHDGNYWTYNSVEAWKELLPYLGESQIKAALKKLEDNGLIGMGNYNKAPYDRTKWYCIKALAILANGKHDNSQPIPDDKPNKNIYTKENSNKEQVTKKKAINKKDIYKDFIEQLKKACKTKSKVKVTKEGLELFQGIENKAQLFKDYLAHQEEKAGFASRITVYMEDYETVHAVKQKEEGEVKW